MPNGAAANSGNRPRGHSVDRRLYVTQRRVYRPSVDRCLPAISSQRRGQALGVCARHFVIPATLRSKPAKGNIEGRSARVEVDQH